MEIEDFQKNFIGYELTREFIFLNTFETNHKNFSDGFYLVYDDKAGISTWSESKDFLDKLMPFAQANGMGSTYALWNDGTGKALNEMPVAVFGGEGGYHIVAENILQLMQLLAYDSEIGVDLGEAYFYKEEDEHKASAHAEEYRNWLKENFSIDGTVDPNDIIKNAQDKYKVLFDSWVGDFYKDE